MGWGSGTRPSPHVPGKAGAARQGPQCGDHCCKAPWVINSAGSPRGETLLSPLPHAMDVKARGSSAERALAPCLGPGPCLTVPVPFPGAPWHLANLKSLPGASAPPSPPCSPFAHTPPQTQPPSANPMSLLSPKHSTCLPGAYGVTPNAGHDTEGFSPRTPIFLPVFLVAPPSKQPPSPKPALLGWKRPVGVRGAWNSRVTWCGGSSGG